MALSDRRRWSAVGLGGVLVAFVGLGALYAFTVPKFLPADETSHVGYALTVGHGDLPRLDSRVPDEVPGMALQYEVRREIYTANHPPLYYLPVAVPLRLGVASGHPVLGFEAARLLTVVMTAVAALATWWTARLLLPRRGDIAVLAAGIAVLLPAVPRFAGVVHNDGFALAVAATAIAVTTRILVLGPSRGRLLAVAGAGAALTLTRAVGIPAAGLVAAGAGAALMLHSPRPPAARILRAASAAVAVGAVALLASGWFWLRSRHLYGDIAGSAYNLERFGYGPRGTTAGLVVQGHWPVVLYRQLWGRIYDSAELAVGWGAAPGVAFAALVVTGAACLLVRTLRRHDRRPLRAVAREAGPVGRGRLAAWFFLCAWLGLVYVSTISYIASGGGVHGRYLFPALPAAALLAGAAIGALPWRRWAAGPVLALALFTGTGVTWAAVFADRLRPDAPWWGAAMTGTASTANGVPSGLVWLTLLLAVSGTAAACWSLVRLAALDVDVGVDGAERAQRTSAARWSGSPVIR